MDYLKATFFFDYEESNIQELVKEFKTDKLSDKEKAVQIYHKIRDGWRYNPYYISFDRAKYKASYIANKPDGHCVDKSILLVACLRAVGIPARIHFAKVKNHIGVERLIEKFGTNEISPHGMVDLLIEGKWLKVSPAFNVELCNKCHVAPLDFDGENDSLFQEFDNSGNTFMLYLEDYGHYEDVPIDFIFENFKSNYPELYKSFKGSSDITI